MFDKCIYAIYLILWETYSYFHWVSSADSFVFWILLVHHQCLYFVVVLATILHLQSILDHETTLVISLCTSTTNITWILICQNIMPLYCFQTIEKVNYFWLFNDSLHLVHLHPIFSRTLLSLLCIFPCISTFQLLLLVTTNQVHQNCW